ncbi:MAG: UDP-N-acetyl glucosamine 2-epimerase, partial [Flavobacteriales bacterium]
MKKKILTIVGARPQIIKAAALSRAIRSSFSESIEERILHTGQHYDHGMSQVFFDEMGIPTPDLQLNLGGGSHGEQTARMLEAIEKELQQNRPAAVLIYGDTNSTLAGALAASKLHIPVIHVEAGLRSFNKTMPEEINRITADHVSSLLFVPTPTGLKNLEREGFDLAYDGPGALNKPRAILCGDVMYDNAIHYRQIAGKQSGVLDQIGTDRFMLATIHRDHNTDFPDRLASILSGLHEAALWADGARGAAGWPASWRGRTGGPGGGSAACWC